MLTQERHLQILAQLEEKGTVSVAQLTQLLGASESTVRRDLIAVSYTHLTLPTTPYV